MRIEFVPTSGRVRERYRYDTTVTLLRELGSKCLLATMPLGGKGQRKGHDSPGSLEYDELC